MPPALTRRFLGYPGCRPPRSWVAPCISRSPGVGSDGGPSPATRPPLALVNSPARSLLVKRDIEGRRRPYMGVVCPGG